MATTEQELRRSIADALNKAASADDPEQVEAVHADVERQTIGKQTSKVVTTALKFFKAWVTAATSKYTWNLYVTTNPQEKRYNISTQEEWRIAASVIARELPKEKPDLPPKVRWHFEDGYKKQVK
jgi:hypothetical protein